MAESNEQEQFEHPLDKMFAAEEEEIKKLVEGQGEESETEAEKTETPEPEPEKKEPEPEPEKKEPPEEEPERKEPPPEERQEKSASWKMVRQLQKEKREVERRLAELENQAKQAKEAEQQAAEEFAYEDPITELQKETQELKQRLQFQEQQAQQRQVAQDLDREEQSFEKEHPDYRDAMRHLVQSRHDEYEALGLIDSAARSVMQNAPDQVEAHARATGKSEDQAAREIAFGYLINNERLQFINAARLSGRSIPQAVYDIAVKRGWKSNGTGAEAPGSAAAPHAAGSEQEARQRVRSAQEVAAAETSLSSMQNQGAPKPRAITKRAQLLQMDEAEQGRYIDEMDKKYGTSWVESLE